MNLDFDINSIEKTELELLNCQVDLILRSLEFYAHTCNFIYPYHRKSENLEENIRISLIRDTYNQIACQINSRFNFDELKSELKSKLKKVS